MKNQTTEYDFTMEGFFICIKHIKMGQARPYNILDIPKFYIPVKHWLCRKELFIMMKFMLADLCLMYPHAIFCLKEYASSIIMVDT